MRSVSQSLNATLAATCQNMKTPAIAQALTTLAPGYFDRPVVDRTGLTDSYNLTLEWITNRQAQEGSDGPSFFEALQKLGLRLDSQKEPVEVLVVDHCESTPTEN